VVERRQASASRWTRGRAVARHHETLRLSAFRLPYLFVVCRVALSEAKPTRF